jgi:hypothetical protein
MLNGRIIFFTCIQTGGNPRDMSATIYCFIGEISAFMKKH